MVDYAEIRAASKFLQVAISRPSGIDSPPSEGRAGGTFYLRAFSKDGGFVATVTYIDC